MTIRNMQNLGDKAAITLSAVCVVHCLLLPVAVVLLPALTSLGLEDESFHRWLVVVVVPISVVTLAMGCKRHKQLQPLVLGGAGLIILCAAAVAGHELMGETWEKLSVVVGAVLIAFGHVKNYLLCQAPQQCDCSR